jgi:hypothetical protein
MATARGEQPQPESMCKTQKGREENNFRHMTATISKYFWFEKRNTLCHTNFCILKVIFVYKHVVFFFGHLLRGTFGSIFYVSENLDWWPFLMHFKTKLRK